MAFRKKFFRQLFILIIIILGIFCFTSKASSIHIPKSDDHGDEDLHDNQSHNDNHSQKNNKSEHGNSPDHHEHVGIHVATLRYAYVQQPLIIAVFLFAAGIFKLGFHHADFLSSRVPESCMLIILGIVVGAIMHKAIGNEKNYPGLSSTLFFLYLLPPIILESAYSLHDRAFYENVGTVIIFAVVGTILNCFLIGPTLFGLKLSGAMGEIDINLKQCLVFSSVIVAVDPVAVLAIFQEIGVNNVLYFLVFGESLLNDAVTVVLYNMMIEFNKMPGEIPVDQIFLGIASFFVVSLGGLTLGILFGVLTAIITKYTEHVRVVEPLTVFVLAYISYLVAELFHFSGIISIIGCGLTQAQYAFHNISTKSHTTIKYFSKMQSATSDCIIFMFLGIALFKSDMFKAENWHAGFILWTLFLCLFYRFIVVFVLTYMMNKSNRVRKIDTEEQFIMAYGGLRGAVAFSLVDLLKEGQGLPRNIFISTTLVVIFFTVFVQGISIKPLVKLLRVKLQEKKVLSITEEINTHVTDHVMAGIEEVLGERGEHYVREILEYYNRKYLKNWLQREPISMDEQIMSMFEKISLQQHFENLAGSKMIQDKYGSSEALMITRGDNTPCHLPEAFLQKLREASSIPEEEEDEEAEESEGSEDQVLPSVTVPQPRGTITPPVIDTDADLELIKASVDNRRKTLGSLRRKSMFPGFNKKESRNSLENPTAKDIRKIMIPARREVQHKKLDKNLKEDSEVDLLRYLQDKQVRTRRMSRAVLGMGSSVASTPKNSDMNLNMPRKSVDASVAMVNYKRRLSLAVPATPRHHRERSPSDVTGLHSGIPYRIGDASQSPDKPARRKRSAFKKGFSLGAEPTISEEQELSPLIKGKSSSSSTPSSPTRPTFDVILENEELNGEGDSKNTSFESKADTSFESTDSEKLPKKKRSRLKKSRSLDQEKVRRANTDPTSERKPRVSFESAINKKFKSAKRRPLTKSESVSSDESVESPESPKESVSSGEGKLRKGSYTQAMTGSQADDNEVINVSHEDDKDKV